MQLEKEIKKLMQEETGRIAKQKIKEFQEFKNKTEENWFTELCFCLLTANTSAEMGLRVQKKITEKQFLCLPEKKLALELKKAGSRFHSRRAHFICEARKFFGIKELLESMPEENKRDFLAKNIKGIGLKEASHFLRNTGNLNYAIIDKHVFNVAKENNLIKAQKINPKVYLETEKKLEELAKKLGLSLGELDLYLWFKKTGKILK